MLFETVNEKNGAHVLTSLANGLTLDSIGRDTFTGSGTNERFRCNPGFGNDAVHNFIAGGPKHDTLALSAADFGSIGSVLAHTSQQNGSAIIHDPASGDTIKLAGTSRADLVHHPDNIHLFG